jgi:hypothetical protein
MGRIADLVLFGFAESRIDIRMSLNIGHFSYCLAIFFVP